MHEHSNISIGEADFRAWHADAKRGSHLGRAMLQGWLRWNDPNGIYTDEQVRAEFGRTNTNDELLWLALEQIGAIEPETASEDRPG